ncbi:MAG TPA: 3'-5' exoribonuclease [bacterium]|nr:3'-5' exoribonuclease [bacterium]
MKYFIDTEFVEKPNTIDLISIGIVGEDGSEYYAIHRDFNLKNAWNNKWVRDNVLEPMYNHEARLAAHRANVYFPKFSRRRFRTQKYIIGKPIGCIRKEIIDFIDVSPELYGYYADYDWVVFCWIFGRMIDLPKYFPMYCRDLKQMMDEKGLDKEWKRENCPTPEGEHNALIDARWNKALYDKINQPQ